MLGADIPSTVWFTNLSVLDWVHMSESHEINCEGVFVVNDNISDHTTKTSKKKCHVNLRLGLNDEVILQYCSARSGPGQEVEEITFNERDWLVFFAETQSKTASIALAKVNVPQECLVVEAKCENKTILSHMEQKLRKNLKVISYDITIRETEFNFSHGVIHIFPDKVLVTQGFPPDLNLVFAQFLEPGSRNEIKCVGKQGLWFSTKPDICVLSEHRDNIWKTLLRCMNEFATTTVSSKPLTSCTRNSCQNLPRPRCYIYINVKDKGKEQYVNMFNMSDTIYQNWKNNHKTSDGTPPPCPPRRPPPRLPPRPRNRPPNSPLPTIPSEPSHHLPRQNSVNIKELQFVVYCSKPLIGHFWVIQVIFMRKDDELTLQRIKKLEGESDYQLLKSLPEHIKVSGDFQTSIELSQGNGCCLRSEATQTVSFEVVKDITLQSCWMVIEFHLEHNGTDGHCFHGKIVMKPTTHDSTITARKDVLISANFKNETKNGHTHCVSVTPGCESLKSLGFKKYFGLCSALDLYSALGKDWMGLAGEVGLTVDEVFKIQSKALFPAFSPTNEVLNVWSQREYSTCTLDELRKLLEKLQRFDVIQSVLDDC